jgi:putative NADPH-quinone reductase
MTLDTPAWFYKYFMGAPGLKAMRSGILEFCGFKLTRVKLIGPIRGSKLENREQWLSAIENPK